MEAPSTPFQSTESRIKGLSSSGHPYLSEETLVAFRPERAELFLTIIYS